MISTVEMRNNGQVTIPDAIRKALGLKTGDILMIDVEKVDPHE